MIDNSNTEIAAVNNTYNQVIINSVSEDEDADPNAGVVTNDSDIEDDSDDDDDSDDEVHQSIEDEDVTYNSNVKIYLCN